MSPVSIHSGWDSLATRNSAQNFRVRPPPPAPVPQGTLGGGAFPPTVPGTCVGYSFGTTNPRMQCADTASYDGRARAVRGSGDRGGSLPAAGNEAMVRRWCGGNRGRWFAFRGRGEGSASRQVPGVLIRRIRGGGEPPA